MMSSKRILSLALRRTNETCTWNRLVRQDQMSNLHGRTVISRTMAGYQDKTPFVPPHLDELPVPLGSWKAHYKQMNSKYNIQLFAGIGFFLFTFIVFKNTVGDQLNWGPPPLDTFDAYDNLCKPPVEEPKCD